MAQVRVTHPASESPPPSTTTPPTVPLTTGLDHFVFTALTDVNKEMGRVEQTVASMGQSISEQSTRLAAVEQSIDRAKLALWIVGGAITLALSFVGWVINKVIDHLPTILNHLPKVQ